MLTVNKINISKAVIIAMFLCTILSCVTTTKGQGTPPLWVTDLNAVFPESEYLAAVGYAQDRTTAEAEAIANVSKIIKQRVEAESSARESFENNLTEQSREYETTVTTSSVIDEIMGLKVQEVWSAKDETVYAVALINRQEVGSFYLQKINENEDAINALLNFMIDNEATFEGIRAAHSALEIAYENQTYLELLSVINPTMFTRTDLAYHSTDAISVLIQLEKEKIYIGVWVMGDVDKRVTNALSDAFKSVGYRSTSLSSIQNPSITMPYVLYGELLISPFEMSSSQNNKYVRFTLNTDLVDIKNKTFLLWGKSGREAHLTEDEAAQRALRTLEEEIEKVFTKEAENLIYN